MKNTTLAILLILGTISHLKAEMFLKGQMDNILPSLGTGVNGNAITPDGVLNISKHSFITPGDILFAAKRRCGDGDVVRFKQGYDKFHFYDRNNTKVRHVFGYWLTEGDDPAKMVPTVESWMPIFYGAINIDKDFTLDPQSKNGYIPLRSDAGNATVTSVTKARIGMLFDQLQSAYYVKPASKNNVKMRVHIGSMMCADFYENDGAQPIVQDKGTLYKAKNQNEVTSYDISQSFTKNLVYKISNMISPDSLKTKDDLLKKTKFDLVVDNSQFIVPKNTGAINSSGPLGIKMTPQSANSVANNPLVKAAIALYDADLSLEEPETKAEVTSPAAATPEAGKVEKKESLLSSYHKKLKAKSVSIELKKLRDQIASKNVECQDLTIGGSAITINSKLWYYPTVMNLECRELTKDFVDLYDNLYDSSKASASANKDDIEDRRNKLAHKLLTIALLTDAQKVAATQFQKRETLRCFPSNQSKYAETIFNGSMIKTAKNDTNVFQLRSPGSSVHPEYLFAIMPTIQDQYKNNNFILFSDRDPRTDLAFSLGNLPAFDPIKSFPEPLELRMQVRSLSNQNNHYWIGPGEAPYCEMYCNNQKIEDNNLITRNTIL